MPADRTQKRRFRGWRAGRVAPGLLLPAAMGIVWWLAAIPASGQQMQHESHSGTVGRGGEGAPSPSAKPGTRDQLMIVGSTVMEHITGAVVRHLAEAYVLPKPITRFEGTRPGIAEFCAGVGPEYPDIVAASYRMSQGEFETCVENNVLDVIQIEIGDSVVVVVTKKGDPVFNLTPRMVYYGLAEDIPDKGAFKTNQNKTWRETNKEAPDLPINVIVPAKGSGTRRYFDDNFMQGGCRHVKEIDAIFAAADRVPLCVTLRDDGPFIEVAEDQIIDALMKAPRGTLAVVAWPAYIENQDKLEALPVNGFLPTHENIDGDDYTMTSTLRYYFKRAHLRKKLGGQGVVEGIQEFMAEIVKDEASGEGGYLEKLGLVPMSPGERRTQQTIARRLKRFEP
jgi:phosphate transport system substrate-binding protein